MRGLSGLSGLSGLNESLQLRASAALLANLIASWDMTDNTDIGRDFHTGGLTLTITGATYDVTENAAKFVAASSQYMSIADRAEIALLNQDFTWEFWFKRTAGGAAFGAPIAKWPDEYALLYGNGTGTYALAEADNAATNLASIAISDNTWYQAFCWYDATANTMSVQLNQGSITSQTYNLGVWRKNNPLVFGSLVTYTAYWNGFLKRARLWKRVLTSAERTLLYNSGSGQPYSVLASTPVTPTSVPGTGDSPSAPSAGTPAKVTFDGDSLTFGIGSTGGNDYPAQCAALLGSSYTKVLNAGVNGQQSTAAYADVGTQIDPQYDPARRSIVVLWIGSNDVATGTAAATTQANIQNYCQWRQNVGFKVVIVTLLPRTEFNGNPTKTAAWSAMNTWLRANYTSWANAIADVQADSRIGDIGDENDTTYFDADKVHLNNTGYGVVAGIVRDVILSLG